MNIIPTMIGPIDDEVTLIAQRAAHPHLTIVFVDFGEDRDTDHICNHHAAQFDTIEHCHSHGGTVWLTDEIHPCAVCDWETDEYHAERHDGFIWDGVKGEHYRDPGV